MKKIPFIYLLLTAFLLIGTGCQNQRPTTSLPPLETPAVLEQKESVSKTELTAPISSDTDSVSVSIDKDFRITNVGDSNNVGDPLNSIFPIHAYNCDIYQVKDRVPLSYSKIDFFLSRNGENASAILLGTTPPGGAGSGECNLYEDESSSKSKLESGKYRMWAVRYIDSKPDKRTPDISITVK